MFQNLFLVKVFKQNKFLFSIFTGYILMCVYFNYTTVETTPFFVWGLYSGIEKVPKTYKINTVSYNKDIALNLKHTYQEPNSAMIYFPLSYYKNMLANNNKDYLQTNLEENLYLKYPFFKKIGHKLVCTNNDLKAYLPWLKTYIQSFVNTPIDSVTVFEKEVQYNTDGRLELLNSKILYSIK